MKRSLIINLFWVAVIGTTVSLTSSALGKTADNSEGSDVINTAEQSNAADDKTDSGDEGNSVELLNKAHGLLVKVSGLGTDPQRKKLLIRARTLIWKVAPDEAIYHGSRKEASLDILAALKEMKQDKPDETVIADHLRRADTELRSAISQGAKATASNS